MYVTEIKGVCLGLTAPIKSRRSVVYSVEVVILPLAAR